MFKKYLGPIIFLVLSQNFVFSQTKIKTGELTGAELNPVESAVPFLTIAPDSRSGAMGDAGVATTPDINSMHWNPSKYAFIENDGGGAFSYTPWLRNLVGDIDLAYLTGYKRLDKDQVIAGSLLYFALGDIQLTDDNGSYINTARPNEFSFDLAYARKFGEKFSGSLAFRFIHSDLSNGISVGGTTTKAANAFAGDVSMYYQNDISLSDRDAKIAVGLDISNMGTKISYTNDETNKDFLPTNLRLGASLTMNLDDYNSLMVTTDLNKLLVPTRPIYYADSTDAQGQKVIQYGMDPDVSVVQGMIQSFYDAPGGFKEEIREITYSIGTEYWYRKQFAIRAGYFHENQYKGNRKYFTMGLGLRLNVFGIDFSYLVPTQSNNPLANTLRFTLLFDFNAFRKLKS